MIVHDDFERYREAHAAVGGSVYQDPAWRAAYAVYGLRTHWLVAEQDGAARGVLVLVRQASRLFGRRLISLPWVDESGATGSRDAVDALLRRAAELAEAAGAAFEVTVKQPVEAEPSGEVASWSGDASGKVVMRRALAGTADELSDDLSPKVRNQIRKAAKSGLVTQSGGAELVPAFYRVYSHNMRDLGSPSHSLRFFQTLVEGLGDQAKVYCTRLDGEPVGGGLVLDNGPTREIPWASSLREHNRLCVNHGLYWQVMADACDAGQQWFSFGRSDRGSGQHKFKKQWGAQEVPLRWHTRRRIVSGVSGESEGAAAVRGRFGLAERLWTKLPLWAARRVGPHIIRHAP